MSSVYIHIAAVDFECDPDVLTERTGISPSNVTRAGQLHPPRRRNIWSIDSFELKQIIDLSVHWAAIDRKIGGGADALALIARDTDFEMDIVTSIHGASFDLSVPRPLFDLARRLQSDIRIAIYDMDD